MEDKDEDKGDAGPRGDAGTKERAMRDRGYGEGMGMEKAGVWRSDDARAGVR